MPNDLNESERRIFDAVQASTKKLLVEEATKLREDLAVSAQAYAQSKLADSVNTSTT